MRYLKILGFAAALTAAGPALADSVIYTGISPTVAVVYDPAPREEYYEVRHYEPAYEDWHDGHYHEVHHHHSGCDHWHAHHYKYKVKHKHKRKHWRHYHYH